MEGLIKVKDSDACLRNKKEVIEPTSERMLNGEVRIRAD